MNDLVRNENALKFIAGFDLAGRREQDGKLHSYQNSVLIIQEFPREVELFGKTYTLEKITKGVNGYETAQYV